ncbi:MAG: DUF4380 domain-containing protein [Mariniphaga sp.]
MMQPNLKISYLLFLNVRGWRVSQTLSWVLTGILLTGALNGYGIKHTDKARLQMSKNGICQIRVADAIMEIDASHGARITSFRIHDQEILTTPAINAENYGSTLWLSPQIWKWPPAPVLDAAPYRIKINKKKLVLSSEADKNSGCQMSKTFIPNKADSSISINYTITNISDKDKSMAPWEVTRVLAGGLTFFPIGTPGGYSKSNLVTADLNGICWFQYVPELVTGHQKLFRNGAEGWLAHANHGLLLIKQFPDIGIEQEAPHETEVEIYTNKDHTYIELENQGRFQTLHPGETICWNVKWYLRKLPFNIPARQGSPELAEYIRNTMH